MTTPSPKYTPEFKDRAVQLYRSTEGATFASIGRELGVDPSSIATWVRKADSAHEAPSSNPFQLAEDVKRLKRENQRLKRENEILLKASAFFASKQL